MNPTVYISESEKITILESTKIIKDNMEFFIIRFFDHFLKTTAGVLFQSSKIENRYRMISSSINVMVNYVTNPDQLNNYMKDIGIRHKEYGVITSNTQEFIDAFMKAIEDVLLGETIDKNSIGIWLRITNEVLNSFKSAIQE